MIPVGWRHALRLAAAALVIVAAPAVADNPIRVETRELDEEVEPVRTLRATLRLDVQHLLESDHPEVAAWRQVIDPLRGLSPVEQAGAVSRLINERVAYEDDWDNYGASDHWALLSETLERGAGDCEDIAIAKLESLAALGWPTDDLALVVGRQYLPDGTWIAHAIALARDDSAQPDLVLDIIHGDLHRAGAYDDFTSVYGATVDPEGPEWVFMGNIH